MIIGFTGYKQSGKSTASAYIQEKTGAVRVNFKDALIAEVAQNFPTLLTEIAKVTDSKDLFTEKPPLMRALLQEYGTEVRRCDNPNYWVDKWLATAGEYPNVVVDDVRFLNEAKAVKDMGGTIVRIVRNDIVSTDSHSSETEMEQILVDHTIVVNKGDFEGLYRALSVFV
jgi:adenylate kinase family enzyme